MFVLEGVSVGCRQRQWCVFVLEGVSGMSNAVQELHTYM